MARNSSKREQLRAQRRNKQMHSYLVWGGLGIAVLAVVGVFVWQGIRPRAGDSVVVMAASHIPTDSDPGQYNSNPPTSGPHYASELNAGFYETNNYKYPAGYLVHNQEHGYVIFWYNCAKLDEAACTNLKAKIKSVMDEFNGVKVIAYPWDSIDVPVAMTSWGRLLKIQTFDAAQARAFYQTNLNHAPEPTAP